MTANSFTSVSLDPPLVLVSVDLRRRTHTLLEKADRFAVNVLSSDHRLFSDRFASQKNEAKNEFDDLPHVLTSDGLPLITDALAHFVCRRYAVYPGGDHSLFLGLVEHLEVQQTQSPLLFFAGRYHTLGAAQ
jgi:flavin reductase (DIM6/NTAB) family NADH-FMN oxidoreductase RutF